MPEPITRRQFLRASAILAGAAVVLDPSWLFDGGGGADAARSLGSIPPDRGGHRAMEGRFAQVEYGDSATDPLVRWTCLGEDLALELMPAAVLITVPTRSETTATIPLTDFEQGWGHHAILHHFGAPTLAQLRTEVSYRRVLIQQPRDETA